MARPLRIQYPGAMYHVSGQNKVFQQSQLGSWPARRSFPGGDLAGKLRVHIPGGSRERIFNGHKDRLPLLDTLAEACQTTDSARKISGLANSRVTSNGKSESRRGCGGSRPWC
jgi:hypothetical protein